MNILLLAPQPFYEERGTPIAVKWVAETLGEAGHSVDLLTFPFGADVEMPGVRVIRAARPAGVSRVPIGFSPQKILCDVHLYRAARRLIREKRYDVVHACEESVFFAKALAKKAGAPLVYDMDSSMADQMMEKWGWLRAFRFLLEGFEKRAMRSSDLVLPVCQSLADKVDRFAPGKPRVLLHDMAMEFPPVPAETERLRESLNLSGPMALYVGNLEHYQGIDLLLEGFAAAREETLSLVIVGGKPADVEKYRARVAALGLSGRAHLLGPRPLNRLSYYLEQADILVSPRLRGVNTPMKIYSYLLAGRAIVATKIESHTQVLEESFAKLVDPTPAAMGEALRALAQSEPERARLGSRAAEIARERHSRAAYRRALLGAYASLGGKP
ncbi:MAG: glycosyltransferase [Kiritimatiellae bacterium]|nr:glycosyltransferase [Kiritimatiellia bacterium]MCO5061609.1 glycosyltransferase [Kiritimatiellia bacterium]MCO5067395.1 glycosyltransferase [Kiritimatiellia bacterium]